MATKVDRVYKLMAKIEDLEIRRIEDVDGTWEKDGKVCGSHYILLSCDQGEDAERIYLIDRNMENIDKYKRGMLGNAVVRIDCQENFFETKAKIVLIDFKENK